MFRRPISMLAVQIIGRWSWVKAINIHHYLLLSNANLFYVDFSYEISLKL